MTALDFRLLVVPVQLPRQVTAVTGNPRIQVVHTANATRQKMTIRVYMYALV